MLLKRGDCMDDNRIVFEEEKKIVKKGDEGQLLTPKELKVYLKQYVRNEDYYIRELIDGFNEIWNDVFGLGWRIALTLLFVAFAQAYFDPAFYPLTWFENIRWYWLVGAAASLVGSYVIRSFGRSKSGFKAERAFKENVQEMQEKISRIETIDRKREDELLLKPDEIPDKFIIDIHKLMDEAIESGYDNYLNDCAILRQLELRYLDVKKSLEDGSEANIIARFPMFYRVYFSMQRSIKEEIMRVKNQNVNAQASKEFLDDSGIVFSDEMLAQASLRIDELAAASVGEPELYLARTKKVLPVTQK